MVTISVGIKGLEEFRARLAECPEVLNVAAKVAMRESTLLLEGAAKGFVPARTGRLRSSINSKVTGTSFEGAGLVGRVGSSVKYAPMVEMGTRPHDIYPINAKALMIPVAKSGGFGGGRLSGAPRKGQAVAFFKHVHHPGTKANPFMRRAVTASHAALNEIWRKAAHLAVENILRAGI